MLGVCTLVGAIIVAIYAALQSWPSFGRVSKESPWVFSVLVHIPQFVVPFALICWITRGRLAEYGFNARQKPPVFTHGRMLALGAAFGLLLSLRYIPAIITHGPIDISEPVTLFNVLGSMAFQWIIVGVSEETMFRGLIQTYLANNLAGYVKIIGHDLHLGTVVGAIVWGLFHFINILIMPIGSVAFTVLFTTLAGLAMGYAYQQTGSLLTTIIVHNTIFGVPLTLGYILYWLL
jgi:membrane protease YdiL (CAAX protease family)